MGIKKETKFEQVRKRFIDTETSDDGGFPEVHQDDITEMDEIGIDLDSASPEFQKKFNDMTKEFFRMFNTESSLMGALSEAMSIFRNMEANLTRQQINIPQWCITYETIHPKGLWVEGVKARKKINNQCMTLNQIATLADGPEILKVIEKQMRIKVMNQLTRLEYENEFEFDQYPPKYAPTYGFDGKMVLDDDKFPVETSVNRKFKYINEDGNIKRGYAKAATVLHFGPCDVFLPDFVSRCNDDDKFIRAIGRIICLVYAYRWLKKQKGDIERSKLGHRKRGRKNYLQMVKKFC